MKNLQDIADEYRKRDEAERYVYRPSVENKLKARIEKLEDDREKLVECLNGLVSSGELTIDAIKKIDQVIAETVGGDE